MTKIDNNKSFLFLNKNINVYLCFFLALLPIFWGEQGLKYAYGDHSFFIDLHRFTSQINSAWIDNLHFYNLGYPNNITTFYFYRFIYKIFNFLSISEYLHSRLLISVLIFFSSYSLLILLKKLDFKDEIIFLLILFYTVNVFNSKFPFQYQHYQVLIFLPLFFYFLLVYVDNICIKNSLKLSLTTLVLVPCFDNIGYPLNTLIAILVFVIFYSFKIEKKLIFKYYLYLFLSLIIAIFLNLWHLYPLLNYIKFASTEFGFLSNNTISLFMGPGIHDNFRFLRQWAFSETSFNQKVYYVNLLFLSSSYLLFFFNYYSIIFIKAIKHQKYFFKYLVITILVYLFFVKGNHLPLGFVYDYLVNEAPGFKIFFRIFREPYTKFSLTQIFLSTLLFGFSIKLINEKLSNEMSKIFNILLIVIILISGYYFINGDYIHKNKKNQVRSVSGFIEVPSYIDEIYTIINSDNSNFRVLSLPIDGCVSEYKNGSSVCGISNYFTLKPTIRIHGQLYRSKNIELMISDSILNEFDIADLLGVMNIKYIVLFDDIILDYNRKTSDDPYYVDAKIFAEKLKFQNSIELIKKLNRVSLYKVKDEYFLETLSVKKNIVSVDSK